MNPWKWLQAVGVGLFGSLVDQLLPVLRASAEEAASFDTPEFLLIGVGLTLLTKLIGALVAMAGKK